MVVYYSEYTKSYYFLLDRLTDPEWQGKLWNCLIKDESGDWRVDSENIVDMPQMIEVKDEQLQLQVLFDAIQYANILIQKSIKITSSIQFLIKEED